VQVPDGFATTAEAFRDFLRENGLDTRISEALDALDTKDTKVRALSRALRSRAALRQATACGGAALRQAAACDTR
jgi:pyruvate,water dikinase